MGRYQEGQSGTGLSPHIQVCRPHHISMARAVALGNLRPNELATAFGFSLGQVSRIMGSPAFKAEVLRYQQDAQIVELDMNKVLRAMTEKALSNLDEDIEIDPVDLDHRKLRQNASLEVLGITGVKKSGGNHFYFQQNNTQNINTKDMDENDIRDEILQLTQERDGTFGGK